jgi:hypothetical protein
VHARWSSQRGTRSARSSAIQKIIKGGLLVGLVSASLVLAAPAPADPAATGATMFTTGPLKRIYLSKTLQCQINRSGSAWDSRAFFPPLSDNGNPFDGACGTFVGIPNGALYGPALPIPIVGSLDVDSYRPYQQGVQSHLTSGPMHCVQTDLWGDFVVYVRQTDCYATGNPFYTTSISLFNPKNAPLVVRLYKVADCRTRSHNKGWGRAFPVGGMVFCTRERYGNNSAVGWAEGFIPTDADGDYPVNTGAKYMEGKAADVWEHVNGIGSNGFGTSSCVCSAGTMPHNNAMGLEWTITIPASGWRTRYLQTRL